MDAFGEVVQFFESCAAGDRNFSNSPKMLERGLARVPVPPSAAAVIRSFLLEVSTADRPINSNAGVDSFEQGRGIAAKAFMPPRISLRAVGIPGEARFPMFVPTGGDQTGVVGPMFEQGSVLLQQTSEGLVAIRLQASLQDEVVGSFQHVDRVDLDESKSFDQALHRSRARSRGGRGGQPLGGEQDAPALPGGNHARMGGGCWHRGKGVSNSSDATFGWPRSQMDPILREIRGSEPAKGAVGRRGPYHARLAPNRPTGRFGSPASADLDPVTTSQNSW